MIVQSDSLLDSLPEGWKIERLGNVSDILFSNVDKHTIEGEIPIRLCNYVDVYKNNRITSDIDFMDASADEREIERFQIAEGDVLVTKDSETPDDIAIPALVTEKLPGVLCGYHLAMIRPRAHLVYGPYLAWLHNCKIFRSHYEANAVGVTRFGLSQADFKEARIPLPSIDEQRRITSYLDKTCAAIDTAIEKKQKQLEALDALRKSILHTAFANGDWPTKRIKDVAVKIGSGVTPEGGASGYLDEGVPLLRSQNVHFNGLRLDDVAFISHKIHAEMAGSQLKPRDVLLNITGASIGRCTFVPENFSEGNVNQHVCIIRCNHKIDYRFLAAYLSSPMGQGQILSSFTGASRQGLSHKELGFIRIPLPTIEAQLDTVAALEKKEAQRNQVRNNIEAQIDTLLAYRKSLIHECVTGKRRITEAHLKEIEAHV